MSRSFFRGAVSGAAAAALVVATGTALAGSGIGDVFNLGVDNIVNAQSGLTGSAANPLLRVKNQQGSDAGTGVLGVHSGSVGAAPGVQGDTNSTGAGATGVFGRAASSSAAGDSNGVKGVNAGAGRGVYGQSSTGTGVYGNSKTGYGVWGIGTYGVVAGGSQSGVWASSSNPSGSGVYGQDTDAGNGVFGKSTSGKGVLGVSDGFDGVYGETHSSSFAGVSGHGGKFGVWGLGSYGVYGRSVVVGGWGVFGEGEIGVSGHGNLSAASGKGVYGTGWTGVYAEGGNTGLYAKGTQYSADLDGQVFIDNRNGTALSTMGGVQVGGSLAVEGTKDFKIDHPLAPKTKYLLHAAIESPEVLNVYSGNVATDARGFATVRLPAYFSAINKDFRYQLTPVGGLVLAAVAQEIRGNRFVIQTSKPHTKVSWQVTGVRNDRYMRAHPFHAVEVKAKER